jgi:hypothetical protein
VRAIGCRDLDHRERIRDGILPRAAVFVRHLDAHEAELAHFPDVLERKLAGLVELGRDRRDALLREIAGDRLDRQLVFGVAEIHGEAPGVKAHHPRRSRESGNPATFWRGRRWVPAFAGTTMCGCEPRILPVPRYRRADAAFQRNGSSKLHAAPRTR